MSEAEHKIAAFIDGLNDDERAVLHRAVAFGSGAGEFKTAALKFLSGLDGNDRERLANVLMAAFEQFATSFPGPDRVVKNTARPHVKTAVDNLVVDICTWS